VLINTFHPPTNNQPVSSYKRLTCNQPKRNQKIKKNQNKEQTTKQLDSSTKIEKQKPITKE
jgi:hypothetical protein